MNNRGKKNPPKARPSRGNQTRSRNRNANRDSNVTNNTLNNRNASDNCPTSNSSYQFDYNNYEQLFGVAPPPGPNQHEQPVFYDAQPQNMNTQPPNFYDPLSFYPDPYETQAPPSYETQAPPSYETRAPSYETQAAPTYEPQQLTPIGYQLYITFEIKPSVSYGIQLFIPYGTQPPDLVIFVQGTPYHFHTSDFIYATPTISYSAHPPIYVAGTLPPVQYEVYPSTFYENPYATQSAHSYRMDRVIKSNVPTLKIHLDF